MNAFFDLVSQQLNDLTDTETNNSYLNSSLRLQDSYSLSRQQSWSHFTHLCSNGKLTSQSKIKRRPLKSNSKVLNKIKEDRFCSTQIISVNSQMMKIQNTTLDKQLNRLQRTIACSKNPNNPRYERQKLLIRRLNLNKENQDTPSKQNNFDITSQFLQEIKGVNEELYQISLNLYRFYEREKEENEKINQSIKMVRGNIQEKVGKIEQEKRKLSKIELQIAEEEKQEKEAEVKTIRGLLNRSFK